MNVYKVKYEMYLNDFIEVTNYEFISDNIEELNMKYPIHRLLTDGHTTYTQYLLIDIDANFKSMFKSDNLRLDYIKNYIIQENRNKKLESILIK